MSCETCCVTWQHRSLNVLSVDIVSQQHVYCFFLVLRQCLEFYFLVMHGAVCIFLCQLNHPNDPTPHLLKHISYVISYQAWLDVFRWMNLTCWHKQHSCWTMTSCCRGVLAIISCTSESLSLSSHTLHSSSVKSSSCPQIDGVFLVYHLIAVKRLLYFYPQTPVGSQGGSVWVLMLSF